jgi:uncharacterized protein
MGRPVVHFEVIGEDPDVETTLATVASLGGSRLVGPDQVPGGPVIGLFVDLQKHVIGLVGGGAA